MNFLKAMIGGCVGGFLGAALWAMISYAINYEVGYVAWGIGFIVGFGVRLMSGDSEGVLYGVLAVVISIGSILAGKYAAVELLLQHHLTKIPAVETVVTDDFMILQDAFATLKEQILAGQKPQLRPGANILDPTLADLPPQIVQEATTRWNAVPPEEKTKRKAETLQAISAQRDKNIQDVRGKAFAGSFGLFDLLWFVLATLTAFRIGSGGVMGDDD